MSRAPFRPATLVVVRLVPLLLSLVAPLAAQEARNIAAHVKFLASDLLEGRGAGARGGELAAEYIAAQFRLAGAEPAGENGTYFQRVPLVGIETASDARLEAASLRFRWLEDWVGLSQTQTALAEIQSELVFAGHGIVAPEYGWDDFKDADVRGKVLLLFTNEPAAPLHPPDGQPGPAGAATRASSSGQPPDDPKFFDGRALTYYGRWTYKFEQALRKGALGALLIHTTPTAGYGWDVVRNSWGREEPYGKLAPGAPALSLAGWLTGESGNRLLGVAGRSVDELLKASQSRDFRPIPLQLPIAARLPARVREIETRNVAALVRGSDPALSSEAVIFTAHWDHLGIGRPVHGDAIYNGAVDNATGCGVLLELARAWAALPRKPRRSALFLAVTAEEGGLRGSQYYARHPLVAPDKTAVAINYDALYPFGRTGDVVVTGAERTALWPLVQQVARRLDLAIQPDPRPEQGLYFRSDHFSLARAGIPAFSIKMGNEFLGKPAGFGDRVFADYNSKHYHQPSDEFREDWDFSGVEQMARFGLAIGIEAASQKKLPERMKLGPGAVSGSP